MAGGYVDQYGIFGKEGIETAWWVINSKVNPSKLNYGPAVTDQMRDEAGVHADTIRYNEFGSVCRTNECKGTIGTYGSACITNEIVEGTILRILPKKFSANMSSAYVRCVRI